MSWKKFLFLSFLIIAFTYKLFAVDTPTTVYTPEGCPVTAYIMGSGTPTLSDATAQAYIDMWGLDATIIVTATRSYNCHGYAWVKSENEGTYWIGYTDNDEETKFFEDEAYSNDDLPSYISCTAAQATHGCYEPIKDHSIRVIKNSYPVSSYLSQTHVSKWKDGPLVRHAPAHDIYARKDTGMISYYKLKTAHNGTLTSYPKTWIGAGNKTHTLTGNTELQSNLKMKTGVTATLNSYYIECIGSGSFTFESGVTLNPHIQRKNVSNIPKGLYPTIASALDAYVADDNVYLGSGTFTENVSMISNCSLIGKAINSTTLNGSVEFVGEDDSEIKYMTVNGDITVNGGTNIYLNNLKAKDTIDMNAGYEHQIWEVTTTNSGYIDLYQRDCKLFCVNEKLDLNVHPILKND